MTDQATPVSNSGLRGSELATMCRSIASEVRNGRKGAELARQALSDERIPPIVRLALEAGTKGETFLLERLADFYAAD